MDTAEKRDSGGAAVAPFGRIAGAVPAGSHGTGLADAGWFVRTRFKMRQLLLLVALDEHRNIHRAADELHLTQPSASKQIMELEEHLGVKLFERLPRGMEPTVFGETMIRHARMALASLTSAHADVMALRSGQMGRIAIGTIATPAMRVLPRAIVQVRKASPTLRFSIQVETSNVLLERLRAGTLDLMIGRLNDDADGLVYEELADERVCVVARKGHPLCAHRHHRLPDLADAPWILSPQGTVLRSRFDWMFRQAGLAPPRDVVDTTSFPLIIALLDELDALHVMPVDLAEHFAGLGIVDIVPIALDCHMDAFGIVRRADQAISPGAGLLVQALRTMARSHGWTGARRAIEPVSAVA